MKIWKNLFAFMQNYLQTQLPPFLTYHDWKHTAHVIEMAEKIALYEHLSQTNIQLIKTAALFHDAGYIKGINKGHEEESCTMVKEILPHYGYSSKEIAQIIGMINATKVPQHPKTKLECILADADLEYLGTADFKPRGDKLLEELQYFHPELTRKEWDKIQVEFLKTHFFHTNYCILNRNPTKEKHLQLLLQTSS